MKIRKDERQKRGIKSESRVVSIPHLTSRMRAGLPPLTSEMNESKWLSTRRFSAGISSMSMLERVQRLAPLVAGRSRQELWGLIE